MLFWRDFVNLYSRKACAIIYLHFKVILEI